MVDLSRGVVEDAGPAAGQPTVLFEEFAGAMDAALAHPEMVAGLARRGLTPDDVFCLPLTAGNYLTPEYEGTRLMKVPCYHNPAGSNFYAKPVEGLFAVVDLLRGAASRVVDEGVVPAPQDDWGYTANEVAARGPLRPASSPVELTQAGGPGYAVSGSRIEWDMWRFRLRVDKRPGLVLSNIDVRDGERCRLRDQGNSVLVVEHDPAVIRAADWVVDIGPRAGDGGGELVFSGGLEGLLGAGGATSRALRKRTAALRQERRPFRDTLLIENASANNLRNVTVRLPKGVLTCVTGVAGSGKSSLVAELVDGSCDEVVVVDQRPVGRSSRSNPATYIGVFDPIRKAFAAANRVSAALFSFNAKGSCPECKGRGYLEVELSFLDDVRLDCKVCEGKRYREEVLELRYRGRSIHDVLEMTVTDALSFFASVGVDDRTGQGAAIKHGLQLLADVGVGYLRLGQPVSTLSGGEAQRLKLATELTRSGNVYVMDEPTTGLHPADIDRLLDIVDRLLAAGNTAVVIEHNLDVIAAADWVVDLGPEGGKDGGAIVAEGTPETVAARHATSHTGRYLKERLGI